MSKAIRAAGAAILLTLSMQGPALASCALVSGPCYTDSRGGTYVTRENLGGGYTTYRNGQAASTTTQTLSGSWREDYRSGGSRSYNYNPYELPQAPGGGLGGYYGR